MQTGVDPVEFGRPVKWTLAVAAGLFLGYQISAVIVPYYAVVMGLGDVISGWTTGAFMIAATIPPFLLAPTLLSWGAGRWLLAAALLMGPPSLLYPILDSAWSTVALSAIRGIGFGIGALATGALVALLAGAHRQGRALGLYGLVTSLTAAIGQAGGLWFEHVAGFGATFVVLALLPAAAALATLPLLKLRAAADAPTSWSRAAPGATHRNSLTGVVRQALGSTWAFLCVALIYGVLVTFGPDYLARRGPTVEVAFFLVVSLAIPLARFLSGMALDRGASPGVMIVTSLMTVAAGMVLLSRAPTSGSILLGGVAFGLGFGTLAINTHVAMVGGAAEGAVPMATAVFGGVWNGGMALGGAAFGPLVSSLGTANAFLIASGACALAIPAVPAWASSLRARRLREPPSLTGLDGDPVAN